MAKKWVIGDPIPDLGKVASGQRAQPQWSRWKSAGEPLNQASRRAPYQHNPTCPPGYPAIPARGGRAVFEDDDV
ncbi:MAG: hypothetical protein IRY96_02505 [Burkholderiales bacterium]|nr:hypothetical protein [Burkholderiales bacterium]